MNVNTLKQDDAVKIELQSGQLTLETVHYSIECGRYTDQPSRIIRPSSHGLPPAIQRWFELRKNLVHTCLPTALSIDRPDKNKIAPILEQWTGHQTLAKFLDTRTELMSELSAVYLTLQAATTLDFLHRSGADAPSLTEQDFVIDEHSSALPRLYFIGWYPPQFEQEAPWGDAAIRFLSRLLYRCLTGSLPPSEQVSLDRPELEESDLGFDNLFLTWVTEERNLGKLGEAALTALRTDKESASIGAFIQEVYPHLRKSTNSAIEAATKNLETDRTLLTNAEVHRQSLKELRTRHQYLKSWLVDNQPIHAQDSARFRADEAYLCTLIDFSQKLRQQLSTDSRKSPKPMPPIEVVSTPESSVNGKGQMPSLMDLADRVEPQGEPFEASLDVDDTHHTVISTQTAPLRGDAELDADEGTSARLFVLVIFLATILGVLLAWSLLAKPLQYDDGSVKPEQKERTQ